MAYSPDFRKHILDFIEDGKKKAEVSHRFNVALSTIYRWLAADDLFAIKKHVVDFPDLRQKERAAHFGVSEFCIG